MSMLPIVDKDYSDGRTKQSFKDSTDINKILAKAQLAGGLSHAMKYESRVYGEFAGYDLLEAHQLIGRAQAIFDDLPSEIRREFDQDAFKYAAFASDPDNIDRLVELLPELAKPGVQLPNPQRRSERAIDGEVLPEVAPVVETPVAAPEAVVPPVPSSAT